MKVSILLSLPAILAVALAGHPNNHLPRFGDKYAVAAPAHGPRTHYANVKSRDVTQTNYTFNQLYQMEKKFLDAFIYPANQIQVRCVKCLLMWTAQPWTRLTVCIWQAKAINSSVFAEDVQGRVDITRTFDGRELNTEYIFGLFAKLAANPNSFTLLGYPTSYEITHFAASQNIASASTRSAYAAQKIHFVTD